MTTVNHSGMSNWPYCPSNLLKLTFVHQDLSELPMIDSNYNANQL